MSSYRDFLRETKGQIDEIDVARARELYDGDAAPLFLDVREREEWDEGHLPGATHVELGDLLHPLGRDSWLEAFGWELDRPEAARLKLREQRHE